MQDNKKAQIYISNFLIFLVVLYAVHLIFSPFYGEIEYFKNKFLSKNNKQNISSLENKILLNSHKQNLDEGKSSSTENIIKNNILYIPSIDLATEVLELEKIEDLKFGSWRIPDSSDPEQGSNTVIVAHRYTDKGVRAENTFYHLPKVKLGEELYLFWNNKKYMYKVYDIKVVEENAVEIEQATTTASILTLYTCTPLWSGKQRHVVQANLVEVLEVK